ncbi:hypothetical protein B0T21DRAFT_366302 [Apiosordaria backusii]|uniref:Secreted protein n=1 Tax=Apiosordaria backusii TaxID=314023 RepID=A0AA40BL13_9PEZI|nr:hypothetical protein B0T21DRAFT_366302 [Apiosordaria backusii]
METTIIFVLSVLRLICGLRKYWPVEYPGAHCRSTLLARPTLEARPNSVGSMHMNALTTSSPRAWVSLGRLPRFNTRQVSPNINTKYLDTSARFLSETTNK